MRITRRDFLRYCTIAAGALGLTATDLLKMEKAMALPGGTKVLWLNGQACTGCTVSLANSSYYGTLQDLTLGNPLLTGAASTLDITFIETLSGVTGDQIAAQLPTASSGNFVLCVEGAIPTGASGDYCKIGFDWPGLSGDVTIQAAVHHFATLPNCIAVLPIGTCACFGGIPGGFPNPTSAKGVLDLFKTTYPSEYKAVRKKTINIPGCPPNPNWIVGTIAYLIASGIPNVDALRRPRTYYGERICNNCDRFGKVFISNSYPNLIGAPNGYNCTAPQNQWKTDEPTGVQQYRSLCLKKVGCKGSRTKSDCSLRKWHSPGKLAAGVNWCVGAGAPCQGCTQDKFPDGMSPFYYIR